MGRFYEFRRKLSDKRQFRLAADKFLPEWTAEVCDVILIWFSFFVWNRLSENQFAERPLPLTQPLWPWILGVFAYLLCMVVYGVHGLDVYGDQSKRHKILFVLFALEPVYVWLCFVLL